MNKQEFNAELQSRLKDISGDDRNTIIDYYMEMIDDRCEEGCTEDDAVAALGSMDEIEAEIREGNGRKVKAKENRKLKAWEWVLIIAGFPVWMPLALAVFAIVLSLYIVLWSLCICIYAVTVSFAAFGLFGICASIAGMASGNVTQGLLTLGASVFVLGLFFLSMLASVYATKGMVRLTVLMWRGIKALFIGRRNEE